MSYFRFLLILGSLLSVVGFADTINVPLDQSSISSAISAATSGDTISIAAGMYNEANLTVSEAVIIEGAGIDSTIISSPSATIFIVTTSNVTIRNLNIKNASRGISVSLSGQTINNLNIANVRIENGTASSGLADGVRIEAGTTVADMEVVGCDFRNNTGEGIHFPKGAFADDLDVINTTFFNNDAGILQRNSNDNNSGIGSIKDLHVTGCRFESNKFEGILAQEISDSVIENSEFIKNRRGVYINKFFSVTEIVDNVVIRGNTFTDSVAQSIWLRILKAATPLGATGITIESNIFNQNVDARVLGSNPEVLEVQGTFEAILEAVFTNDNGTPHGPLNINKNTFNLTPNPNTGGFSGTTSAETAFAIALNGGFKTVTIESNIMDGDNIDALPASAVKTSGIFFITNDNDAGFIAAFADVKVERNKIVGFESGASLFDFADNQHGRLNAGASISFFNNFIENDMGITSGLGQTETVNASGNWWGSNNENAVNSMIVGEVDFTPFLTSNADTDGDSANGFQGDFSSLTATNLGFQVGSSTPEQEKNLLLNNTPTFTSTPIMTITAGSTYTYNITSNDADVSDTLTLTAPILPSWLQLTNVVGGAGTLTGQPGVPEINDHNIELVVTDSKDFIKKQQFIVTVSASTTTTLSITLKEGWNHISLNVDPPDSTIRTILGASISKIDRIIGEEGEFDPLDTGDTNNTLINFADGKGYWVKVKESQPDFPLNVDGEILSSGTIIPLAAGWNNVGFLLQNNTPIRTALDELISANKLIRVVGRNASFDPTLPNDVNTLQELVPGQGYWIKVQSDVTDFNFLE